MDLEGLESSWTLVAGFLSTRNVYKSTRTAVCQVTQLEGAGRVQRGNETVTKLISRKLAMSDTRFALGLGVTQRALGGGLRCLRLLLYCTVRTVNVKTDPCPDWLVTWIVPPCATAIARHIASPIPVPETFAARSRER